MSEIKNAIIDSVELSNSDHGCLSGWLRLDYGGGGQCFGGLALFPGTINYAGKWIQRCLDIAGVTDWAALPGRCIRVKIEDELIRAIGHIIEDDWFNPKVEFEAMCLQAEELAAEKRDATAFHNLSPAERMSRLRAAGKLPQNDRDFATMYRDRPE